MGVGVDLGAELCPVDGEEDPPDGLAGDELFRWATVAVDPLSGATPDTLAHPAPMTAIADNAAS
ncbi:MAG TPA: hypothetical protein VMA95_02660 [Streptosporangiaceae bacterium]|nr:hypothetical protein [Streptosporangiaceae bacterium]